METLNLMAYLVLFAGIIALSSVYTFDKFMTKK